MESEKILGVVFCVVVLCWCVTSAARLQRARTLSWLKRLRAPAVDDVPVEKAGWLDELRRAITVADLLAYTAGLPMKQIDIDGKPYLQRYYLGTTTDGYDIWLHRFLSQDGDRHLHNHPFEFKTVCLHGGYVEELKTLSGVVMQRLEKSACALGNLNFKVLREKLIFEGTARGIGSWHRIASVEPETWTVILVNRANRVPFWYFEDEDGYTAMPASGPDWWKGAKTRAEQAGDGVVQEVWHG